MAERLCRPGRRSMSMSVFEVPSVISLNLHWKSKLQLNTPGVAVMSLTGLELAFHQLLATRHQAALQSGGLFGNPVGPSDTS